MAVFVISFAFIMLKMELMFGHMTLQDTAAPRQIDRVENGRWMNGWKRGEFWNEGRWAKSTVEG